MYRIGIDLGGTNIVTGIITDEGSIIEKSSVPTLAEQRTGEDLVRVMAEETVNIIRKNGFSDEQFRSIGIGTPGVSDSQNGVLIYTVNLPFVHTDFRTIFKEYTAFG